MNKLPWGWFAAYHLAGSSAKDQFVGVFDGRNANFP